jgi:hypothetical protein
MLFSVKVRKTMVLLVLPMTAALNSELATHRTYLLHFDLIQVQLHSALPCHIQSSVNRKLVNSRLNKAIVQLY